MWHLLYFLWRMWPVLYSRWHQRPVRTTSWTTCVSRGWRVHPTFSSALDTSGGPLATPLCLSMESTSETFDPFCEQHTLTWPTHFLPPRNSFQVPQRHRWHGDPHDPHDTWFYTAQHDKVTFLSLRRTCFEWGLGHRKEQGDVLLQDSNDKEEQKVHLCLTKGDKPLTPAAPPQGLLVLSLLPVVCLSLGQRFLHVEAPPLITGCGWV